MSDRSTDGERPSGTKRVGTIPGRPDGRPGAAPRVRSGLAERRNPVAEALSNTLRWILNRVTRDLFATGLLLAATALTILFFVLLGGDAPESRGTPIPLSTRSSSSREEEP